MKATISMTLLLLFLLFFSCKDRPDNSAIMNYQLLFNIALSDGTYLFDKPEFDKKAVRISYLENGQWQEYYGGDSPNYPYGYEFRPVYGTDKLYIWIALKTPKGEDNRSLRIKFNSEITDELNVTYYYLPNNIGVSKLIYNGVEIKNFQPHFTVQK